MRTVWWVQLTMSPSSFYSWSAIFLSCIPFLCFLRWFVCRTIIWNLWIGLMTRDAWFAFLQRKFYKMSWRSISNLFSIHSLYLMPSYLLVKYLRLQSNGIYRTSQLLRSYWLIHMVRKENLCMSFVEWHIQMIANQKVWTVDWLDWDRRKVYEEE